MACVQVKLRVTLKKMCLLILFLGMNMHPLVSTVGEGSWLEVGLARAPCAHGASALKTLLHVRTRRDPAHCLAQPSSSQHKSYREVSTSLQV